MTDANQQAIIERFDERATRYDDNAMHRALAGAVVGWVDIAGVRTVLDVGTGTGLVLRSLARRSDALDLVGIDISAGMLEVARRELPSARLLEGDALSLPLPDDPVDLVTCVTVLHLFPDPAPAMAEWARVLRPGGRAVTATFSELPPRTRRRQRHQSHHDDFRTPAQVSGAGASAGFSLSRHTTWEFSNDAAPVELVLCELVL